MSFLEQNLAAMRPYTPATVELVRGARVPEGFVAATGTDGTATFLRSGDQLEWLGETSMPASSAGPLVASLDPGSANGMGLSIGTGYEWLAFLERLPRNLALYVYESDAGLLRMALTVCDLAMELASARLVIVGGSAEAEAGGDELAKFLATHPGHEPPAVLHPLPTLTGDRRNALLAGGEAIVRRAVQSRQVVLNALAREMAGFSGGAGELALLATERYRGERPVHEVLDAGVPRLFVDQHGAASVAVRAQTILTRRPAKVVSDFFRADLGCVPASVAVETWVPPLVGPVFWQPGSRVPGASTILEHDRVVVQAQVHRSLLEGMGIPARQIEFRALKMPASTAAARIDGAARVALIADLPRTDAEALGIQLPTHQAVHAAASALIVDDYLDVNFNQAGDILRRALAKAGVSASAAESDPGLQESMLRIIRDILIPALPVITLARTLVQQEVPLRLIGDWPGFEVSAGKVPVVIESFNTFWGGVERWKNTTAVVHLSPWGTVSPIMLEAAAAQVPVIAPRHPTDGFEGALPQLLGGALIHRPQAQQLVPTIKSVVRKQTA